MKFILVASRDLNSCRTIKKSIGDISHLDVTTDLEQANIFFLKKPYDFFFVDVELLIQKDSYIESNSFSSIFRELRKIQPHVQIITLCSSQNLRIAVNTLKEGGNDYLTYPIDPIEISLVMETLYKNLVLRSEVDYLRDYFWKNESQSIVNTKSSVMKKVFETIKTVAPTIITVLLTGETGVGKGVMAQLIHRHSNRCNGKFISVHCGAIPENLIESELFGHEKGSFTGALRRRLGKFEIAQGGTLFLDEIGTISHATQIKLLSVLQDKIYTRVGGEETISSDVRIIAASNENMKDLCSKGLFRRDLYYRLNVFPIEIPPLRDRNEDILLMANSSLKRLNQLYGKNIESIHPRLEKILTSYDWPGNIRELENLIERAYILEASPMLTTESLPEEVITNSNSETMVPLDASLTLSQVRKTGVEALERDYLKELLSNHKGKIGAAALTAGITTRQLHKLMTKYDIHKEDFK